MKTIKNKVITRNSFIIVPIKKSKTIKCSLPFKTFLLIDKTEKTIKGIKYIIPPKNTDKVIQYLLLENISKHSTTKQIEEKNKIIKNCNNIIILAIFKPLKFKILPSILNPFPV